MTSISERLQGIRTAIAQAALQAGRDAGGIRLLAVSKTKPASAIREAYAAGQTCFGENYAQEGIAKMVELADLPLEWHFIGPIQSNKTRPIAEHFHWVHGIDRLKIAQRLSDARPVDLPALDVCLQVNISGEASKEGVTPAELPALVDAVARLPQLKLRGLMAIPAPTHDIAMQHQAFRMLREQLEALNRQGHHLDTLSMGMSEDFPAAIAEGATIVRVGSAIFGARTKNTTEPTPTNDQH